MVKEVWSYNIGLFVKVIYFLVFYLNLFVSGGVFYKIVMNMLIVLLKMIVVLNYFFCKWFLFFLVMYNVRLKWNVYGV